MTHGMRSIGRQEQELQFLDMIKAEWLLEEQARVLRLL